MESGYRYGDSDLFYMTDSGHSDRQVCECFGFGHVRTGFDGQACDGRLCWQKEAWPFPCRTELAGKGGEALSGNWSGQELEGYGKDRIGPADVLETG